MTPSVLHLSTFDVRGGAARAAYALHRAMVDSGIDSTMRVGLKSVDDQTVIGPMVSNARRTVDGVKFLTANVLEHQLWKLQRSSIKTWRSPGLFGSLSARAINASAADVVNIHWATDGFLSIKEIGRITKPVVWSLYDMWPFSGTEHYGNDAPDARWRTGYTKANTPTEDRGMDLDRISWERKMRLWSAPRQIVAASSAFAQAAHDSALMGTWPIHTIPHVIDCDAFAPMSMDEARLELGLPLLPPLILFIASGGIADQRKGWDLLEQALPRIKAAVPDVEVVIVGPSRPDYQAPEGVPIHWAGSVHGDRALRLHYSAATVTAVPSREDNMPLTAMEAQACGRPVVAFRIGGLPDIIEHEGTGYLAVPFDTEQLVAGFSSILTDPALSAAYGQAARDRAVSSWSPTAVVTPYLEVYAEAIAKQ
jgi:glycosyltransferase involved in cell wall biosynthesis